MAQLPRALLRSVVSCAFLNAALAVSAPPAHAQSGSAVVGTRESRVTEVASDDMAPPRNAFAQNLRPRLKRPASQRNVPYAPIKKQDDQGRIPEIEMFVGESRVFPAPDVARIAVGNGRIMTAAALDSKEVIVFANDVGTSSLFVWNEDGRYQRVKVNIVPGDTTRVAREVAAFLTAIPNTKASIVGDKVIVEGDDLSDADLAKVEQLQKPYPQIVNFTNRIGWEQMVMMDVKVVEFPSSELREIGLKWNATGGAAVGGIWRPISLGSGPFQVNIQNGQNNTAPITNPDGSPASPPAALNILSAVNMGLNAQLNLLAQEGKASVLAEPQLSARSGARATFLAGGEFPYSVANTNGVTIQFKKYGINLQIVPKVDRNGVIRATIEAEVSSIDASVSTPSGPALLTRRTETEFNVRSGETIVLSGLLQRSSSTDIEKVPLLGDIPILGALFRSKRFQNKETELVVFVTPTVVDSHSAGLVDRIQRTTERLQQRFGSQPYLTEPLQPGHDAAQFASPASAKNRPERPAVEAVEIPRGHEPAAPAALVEPAARLRTGALSPTATSQNEGSGDANSQQAEQRPLTGGSSLRVKKDGLVLRTAPHSSGEPLLELGQGAIVLLGPMNPEPPGIGSWRNVVVGGINGWVLSEGIEPAFTIMERQNAIESRVAHVDQGDEELAIGRTGSPGIIPGSKQLMTATEQSAPDNPDKSPPKRYYKVMIERLALRVTPDINAAVVRNLTAGQLVEALDQPARNNWAAVRAADGSRGWVASQWLDPVLLNR